MDQLYFAYGSNLLSAQLLARVGLLPDEATARLARLAGYRLAFNKRGRDGRFYANIVQPGEGVIGIVYRCNEDMLAKLDRFETGYRRQKVLVVDDQGAELLAIGYVSRPDNATTAGQPSAEYLQRIVMGAREHGLPEEYIRGIQATAGQE